MKSKDLIESQLPSHFLEQYPQFVKFLEQYYDFLECTVLTLENNRSLSAGDVLYGVLSKGKAEVKSVSSDRIYFNYQTDKKNFYKREILINQKNGELYEVKNIYSSVYNYIQKVEDNTCYDMAMNLFKKFFRKNVSLDASIFRRIDPNILTKRILDYYKNKGSERSFYWFFRIFFDEEIELYYPKVDILRLSDSDYRVRQWVQIERVVGYEKMKSASIYAEGSQTSAIVRDVNTTSVSGVTKAFLDLVFVNGEFNVNEEIVASDYITGEELVRTRILPSAVGVVPTDGGIAHEKEDRFRFGSINSDGKGTVIQTKQYSVTNIIPEHRGICYSVGNEIDFNNNFTGATVTAKAKVSRVNTNEALTDWINSYSDNAGTIEIQKISSERIVDIWDRVIGESLVAAETNNVYTYTPVAFQNAASQVVDIGSIAEIEFERSGIDYKFAPEVSVSNEEIDTLKNFLYFEIVVNEDDHLYVSQDMILEIFGRRGFCIGVKEYESGTLDIGLLSEPFKVLQIIVDKPLDHTLGNLTYPDTAIDTFVDDKLIDYIDNETYFEFSEIIQDNNQIKLYPNSITVSVVGSTGYSDSSTFLLADGSIQAEHNVKFIDSREIIKIALLNKTAELSSVLGQGVSELKLSELGLIGGEGLAPVFKEEVIKRRVDVQPEYQSYNEFYQKIYSIYELWSDPLTIDDYNQEQLTFGNFIGTKNLNSLMAWFDDGNKSIQIEELIQQIAYDRTRAAHNLPATLAFEYGAMYKQFGEYVDRGSHLSSDKYIQDNYYYQNFSYEIRTKVQAKEIEPLLMDELHPAGFIMFVRNKFESELRARLDALEFPEIEIESKGLMETIAEQVEMELENSATPTNHPGMREDDVTLEPEIDIEYDEDMGAELISQKEIEWERIITDLQLFHYFWEDVVTIPEHFNLNTFNSFMKTNQDLNIVNATMMFDLVPSVQSYMVVKLLEDESNWRTTPIRQRTGAIGELGGEPITNLRTSSESQYFLENSHNYGGVIIVRDDPYSVPVVVGNLTNRIEDHGFYPGAEIYTKTGWVQFQNLQTKEEIAHVQENGKIIWKPLKKIHIQKFNGKMHLITNARAMTSNFIPALDRMVVKNINAPISSFAGEVVIPHKVGAKVDDASVIVAPKTDLVLFASNERYQKVSAESLNYNDQMHYIASINEDLIDFPVSIVNRNEIPSFRRDEIGYEGDIYTISLDNIKPNVPVHMKWGEVGMTFYDMARPEDQAKFGLSLKEVVQKVSNISEIRSKDPTLTDAQNRGRIEKVKFGESMMYLLNVNDAVKGSIPQTLDDTRMFRFAGFEIPVLIQGFELKTNIVNEKVIFDRNKCFDVNGNILPDAPISQLAGGRLMSNMRETIPTVSSGETDYTIFNVAKIEHIKPELKERYDQIHVFEELFMELSTNQVCFFINSTNTVLPALTSKEQDAIIYVESEGEKHKTELLENVIDVETFAYKNMFMKLNEHPIEVEIHRHIPDRWKCVDVNQQIPFDQVIGNMNVANQKIWENIRESIPTARIVENETSLIMDLLESMPHKIEGKLRETKIIVEHEHKFDIEGETNSIEVEVYEHHKLPDIVPLESEKEIHRLNIENLRKEFEEKDTASVVVSSQSYKLETKGDIDAFDIQNEIIIFNRNYIFDATKPIDILGNQPIKDYYLKLRPKLSLKDTLPTGKISEFAVDIETVNSVESVDIHNLVEEIEVEIDSVMETRNNLQHLVTGMKIENLSRIWNSNFVYELDTSILEMYNLPVEDLNNIAIKQGMGRISCPNGSSVIECFEIHQETSTSVETKIVGTEYQILPDVIESTPIRVAPLPNEIKIQKNPEVSVEFVYLFEREIRTEKMVGDLVTEKYSKKSSVHAIDDVELEQLSRVLFNQKGSVSKTQEERLLIDETKLAVSPIYRIIKERSYETPWKLDEISSDFLTSQWATPYFGKVVDDYMDKVLHDRDADTYLHHNLNIQYVYPESIQYSANGITELLNSNNYIDEDGITLPPGSFANYDDIIISSNTYIKTLSAMENFYVS